ncbi:MAG: DUF4388 domain-containing protein [Chitinispirillales bacterium]|jgi:hypothetical protein|nr:DUF4388 domain-containing protein [Chitinispirillales bacterium]
MVLSGNLTEFILADVFNLLTQQKITGKLSLSSDQREGIIIFKDGVIAGAQSGDESLRNKLFNYLIDIKKKSSEHLSQLFNAHSGSLSGLCSSILERSLMSTKEFRSFAEGCVEDIACNLLTWKSGTYRFNSLQGIASMVCGAVNITTESIIMEGMRRADEWVRMQEYIVSDAVFVKANRAEPQAVDIDIFTAPEAYVLNLLDGSRTVFSIVKSCCLCEFKVYESINILLQEKRIIAISSKYSQSIQAALSRKDSEKAAAASKAFLSACASLGTAAAIFAIFLFCRFSMLSAPQQSALEEQNAARRSQNRNIVQAATLLHRALNGEEATSARNLQKAGLLTPRDF